MKHKLIGILIEPRKVKQIFYSIDNFFDVLPNTFLYFFCGKGLKNTFKLLLKKYKNLKIVELKVNNLNFVEYSDLFKSIDFMKQFDSQYILTIQTDGCLCNNSKFKIKDFYNYDYIGGYAYQNWWKKEVGNLVDNNNKMCFNGGFSLRKISSCIKVLENFKPLPSKRYYSGIKDEEFGEDLYYVKGMLKLGLNVGLDNYAINFCTHTKYITNTFCVHKLKHYEKDKIELEKFNKYCTEYKNFYSLENL